MKNLCRAFGIAAIFAASPALAIDVAKSIDLPEAPAKVWAVIGDFCGIGQWHPAVEKCADKKDGGAETRVLTLAGGGGTLTERLVSRDEAGMAYTYGIVDGPLPVANYVSTLKVAPKGTGSTVTWTGSFAAKGAPDAKAEEVVAGIYEGGLKAIGQKSAAK